MQDVAQPDPPSDVPGDVPGGVSHVRQGEPRSDALPTEISAADAAERCAAVDAPSLDASHPATGAEPGASGTTRPMREPRTLDTSAPAIAATVALVGFSIFIGVVGPRLGNRQPLPPGTTLVELADAMTARHSESVVGAIHAADEPPFERVEIAREFERLLGRDVAVPDLSVGLESLGFRWSGIRGVRMPGGAGAVAFGRFRGDAGPDFASIAVLRDQGNFIVYDPYGRPVPLPEGEVFSVTVEGRQFGSTVLAYRDGDLVYAMQADSADALERMAARFQAAAAADRAGGDSPGNEPEGRNLDSPDSGGVNGASEP